MNSEILNQYAPTIIVVLWVIFQQRFFVTPEQLERTHRELLDEIERKFATKETGDHFEKQIADIQAKVDKIYDKVIGDMHE